MSDSDTPTIRFRSAACECFAIKSSEHTLLNWCLNATEHESDLDIYIYIRSEGRSVLRAVLIGPDKI